MVHRGGTVSHCCWPKEKPHDAKPAAVHQLLMAGTDERAARDVGRKYPPRKRYDTPRDPQAGYGGGSFTADRPVERIGPACVN